MASEDAAENRLLALYRRYVGEPEKETDVYLGFALFFGGIALGALGFVLFLGSSAVTAGSAYFWQLREIAITLAAAGLPAFMLGIVVLLPTSRRIRYGAAVGGVLCLVAIGVFIAVYPSNWNVPTGTDYSAQGIAVYAGGVTVLVAATGAALVGHHLERARAEIAAQGADAGGDATTGTTGGSGTGSRSDSVSDEQIARDIDDAMSNVELSWGGVEKRETKRLKLNTATDDVDVDRSGFDESTANTARSESVDDAVAGLRKLQGGEREQAASDGVDDQTNALRQLREQQTAEEPEDDSVLERIRGRFGLE